MRKYLATAGLAGLLIAGLSGTAHADPEPQTVVTPPVVAPCAATTVGSPIVVPNEFLTALSDTRTAGHYELAGTALHVYTDNATSQAKVAEYVTASKPLGQVGEPALVWAGSTPPPGFQLVVDLENDGTPDGILVGEPTYYGNRWWASNALIAHIGTPVPPALASPGGDGSTVAGTLTTWLQTYPSTQVMAVGFSLGSGVKGDGAIASMTFACITRTFTGPPVVTTEPSTTAPSTSASTTTSEPSTSASTTAPSTSASTTTTPAASTTAATTPAASTTPAKATPVLAATGSDTRLLPYGLVLLAGGALLVVAARRRAYGSHK